MKRQRGAETVDTRQVDKVNRKTEMLPIREVFADAYNPKQHPMEQVEKIARSIEQYGFVWPILVDALTRVVAGHGRLMAARLLKLKQVPVIRVQHLTEEQIRAFRIADNKVAESPWDEQFLRLELDELLEAGADLELTGFGPEELAKLRGPSVTWAGAGLTDEDFAPEIEARTVTAAGDLWRLGRHQLLCGDALENEGYARLLEGQKAAMVFTDPPYNVDYGGSATKRRRHGKILNDNLGEDFERFLLEACKRILSWSAGALYIAMSSAEIHNLQRAFIEAGGHWSTFIIWAKDTFTLGRSDYQRQYEPILYGWREGGKHFWCGGRDQGDLWLFERPRANEIHPTMKPVALVARAIRNSSKAGDVVLDPFAGSGSTLIACEKAGRTARVIELAQAYCDVIVRRWQAFTGEEATLEGDGRPFEEISANGRKPAARAKRK